VSDDATEHNSLNVEEFVYDFFFLFFLRPRSICWITVENVSLLVNAESATKPSETGNNSNNNKPTRTAQKPRAPAGQKDASYLVNSIK